MILNSFAENLMPVVGQRFAGNGPNGLSYYYYYYYYYYYDYYYYYYFSRTISYNGVKRIPCMSVVPVHSIKKMKYLICNYYVSNL